MDKSGQVVIKPEYDDVGFFYPDDTAPVQKNGKWGRINKTGEMIIPMSYDKIWSFWEERGAVMINGKWGYIDKKNNLVVPPLYDTKACFENGLAWVEKEDKWGYIDIHGNEVLEVAQDFDFHLFKGFAYYAGSKGKWSWWKPGKELVPPEYGNKEVYFEKWKAIINH